MPSSYDRPADLESASEIADAIVATICTILLDCDPADRGGGRIEFSVGASLERGMTGYSDIDETLRDAARNAPGYLSVECISEIDTDAIAAIALKIFRSRERPPSQLVDGKSLEFLVSNEVASQVVPVRPDRMRTFRVESYDISIEKPSLALALRCVLSRTGLDRLEPFSFERLLAYLNGLTGPTVRVAVVRLLREMLDPKLIVMRVAGSKPTPVEELEEVATAFRVQYAFETGTVYVPVLDVERLDSASAQPSLVRQIFMRGSEIVSDIGEGRKPMAIGENLVLPAKRIDAELSLRYLRAVGAREPFGAFMGFYHLLEGKMIHAWRQTLVVEISLSGSGAILPAEDVRLIAKVAAAALGKKQDEIRFTEIRALTAVLESYVDMRLYVQDLLMYSDEAIRFFEVDQPGFVNTELLEGLSLVRDGQSTPAGLHERVAKRIYGVRCAITHSKESQARYSPYVDDVSLAQEVPLVRLAAEQVLNLSHP